MPLLATHMARRDIRAIADGEDDVLPRVHRAAKLRMIAPNLRAKGSDEALSLFLSHNAVSPSGMLSPMVKGTSFAMTDRAARRLCDRLVDLGVMRELTGRATFRLYGV